MQRRVKMIILNEISEKLQKVLNNIDTEISIVNPLGYRFVVMTQGFHIDSINGESGNFIPVFVSSMTGTYNAVPSVNEANATIPITFYFPVRFKDDFFFLNDFLAKVFVGKYRNYGTYTGKAISNISVPTFGEIQNVDMKEFRSWIKNQYQKEIDVMEAWMSMTVNLYLSNMDASFLYGNDSATTLTMVLNGTTYTENAVFVDSTIQSNSEISSQQILGSNESSGMPNVTAYGFGMTIYYQNDNFCNKLIEEWFNGNSQSIRMTYSQTLGTKTFTRTSYIQNMNISIKKGQAVTITLSFGKAI